MMINLFYRLFFNLAWHFLLLRYQINLMISISDLSMMARPTQMTNQVIQKYAMFSEGAIPYRGMGMIELPSSQLNRNLKFS